jgi:acyl-homoserine-lactone acylase
MCPLHTERKTMRMRNRITRDLAVMTSRMTSTMVMSAAPASAAVVSIAMISVAAMSVAVMSLPLPLAAQMPAPAEIESWQRRAQDVTIVRDRWGIAHVYGRTDADAVFGMEYAQAEDDFHRVEMNYVVALGRLAEMDGESAIWQDLRAKMYADPDSLQAAYARSPDALKKLMDAFADGLNYYLYTHPDVKPRVITRFEPWMALSFTEGSIGGDIERIDLRQLAEFYGGQEPTPSSPSPRLDQVASWPDGPAPEPRGSNGIAIAPKNTLDGHALLYINPHTSFYFRSELQMTSDEGLNAYGAVTWGQFFIYQGFNEHAGWMHTSSGVDNIDWFLETPVNRGGRYHYRDAGDDLPMATREITIPYRAADGMAERTFTAYFTRRGPIVGRQGEHWLSVSLMWQPVNALTQSYMRTKAQNLDDYLNVMELHTNASNNTLFADAEGNVAYLHSNYIPRRDTTFDWGSPVDASDPATGYRGVLSLEETPNVINPDVGWVYNANNWPWSAAGPDSPRREDYPAYVETGRWETPRGYHALELLPDRQDFTMASLTELGFDSHLPAFEGMIPALVRAYDALPASSPRREALAKPVEVLRGWDYRWGVNSVATSLAVFWGEGVLRQVAPAARAADVSGEDYVASGTAADGVLLEALSAAVERLETDFGTWRTPWGQINRFQRISPEIGPHFDDDRPSIPVPFTSARWGSLASFGARPYPNTKRWYGTSGNSFIAVVEFGDSVRARAVTAGGESGDPASPHFNDQAAAYAMGALRDVYFYRPDVEAHMESSYRPGEGTARR